MRRVILCCGALLLLAAPLAAATVNGTLGIAPGSLAGADSQGRAMLFAPNPFSPGSSVSHFDSAAFPNLLMEPAVGSNLGFAQLDLTPAQLRDSGWQGGNSTITLRNQDPPGQGFNDPNLGSQRLTAMQFVADTWAARLRSPVQINVDIGFTPLQCSNNGAVLAQAAANFLFKDFAGAPVGGTWYHGPLAEALSGQNLSLQDVTDPNAGDLGLQFNSNIDTGCLQGSSYHYPLTPAPGGTFSFVNVALHEMAHGLGFSTFTNANSGAEFMGAPTIFDRFALDNTSGLRWHEMTNAQRKASAVNSGHLVWAGANVTAQVPNVLQPGPALTIHSPSSVAGVYQVSLASFGPQFSGGSDPTVRADLVLAQPVLACGALPAAQVGGRIAVVDRGSCDFDIKVRNAQNAGAVGVLVVNNVAGSPIPMGGDDTTIGIPSMMVSMADGGRIKNALAQAGSPGQLRFAAGTFSAGEASGSATVTVERTGGDSGEVSVDIATGDGSAVAGADYLAVAETVSFADGVTSRTVQVPLVDDAETEGDETVQLTLGSPAGGATLGSPAAAVLTIVDDDVPGSLQFEVVALTVGEGAVVAQLTVSRLGGSAGEVTVDVATADGSATAGLDYLPLAETLVFPDRDATSRTVQVAILDDGEEENDESFVVLLANPTGGASLGQPSETVVTIVDSCQPSATAHCLNLGRFRVESQWRDFAGGSGPGFRVAGTPTDDSGLIYFFDPVNFEVLIKVLDGCAINGHFWVFAAATTNVEYTLTVTDTLTGEVQEYSNPLGVSADAVTDTEAFAACGFTP